MLWMAYTIVDPIEMVKPLSFVVNTNNGTRKKIEDYQIEKVE